MPRDDKLAIMEHEVSLEEPAVRGHCRNRAVPPASAQTRLAVITLIIFICTLVFLFAFLVTPLFWSVNHPLPGHSHSHEDDDDHHDDKMAATMPKPDDGHDKMPASAAMSTPVSANKQPDSPNSPVSTVHKDIHKN